MNTGKVSFKYMDAIIQSEAGTLQNKNTGNGSKFKNYPANYEISETEKNSLTHNTLPSPCIKSSQNHFSESVLSQ